MSEISVERISEIGSDDSGWVWIAVSDNELSELCRLAILGKKLEAEPSVPVAELEAMRDSWRAYKKLDQYILGLEAASNDLDTLIAKAKQP